MTVKDMIRILSKYDADTTIGVEIRNDAESIRILNGEHLQVNQHSLYRIPVISFCGTGEGFFSDDLMI